MYVSVAGVFQKEEGILDGFIFSALKLCEINK